MLLPGLWSLSGVAKSGSDGGSSSNININNSSGNGSNIDWLLRATKNPNIKPSNLC